MARIAMLEPTAEPVELRAVFNQLRSTRGRVPGMYRTLAHRPQILAAHRAYFHAALDDGVLPRPFKEKIAYKVARLRGSAYCTGSHQSYALKHGVTSEELAAIDNSDYTSLPPEEAAAMGLAETMIHCKDDVPEKLFEQLRVHYDAKEIVEIVALVGIMELACTLAAVFGLKPD